MEIGKPVVVEGQRDRVRAHGPETQNKRVDEQTQECLAALASADRETISRHLEQCTREWDMERYLETNASIVALAGVALGALKSPKWFLLPGLVFGFLLQHGLQGWCPPMPIFRRIGVRTRKEINRERFALKALRGDLAQAESGSNREAA
jgi:hypothetical protein